MVKGHNIIRTLVLLVLLVASAMTHESWATVTYHIINLGTTNQDGSGHYYRVEAMRCTSDAATIGLPTAYKSPLAKNFKYYRASEISSWKTGEKVYINYPHYLKEYAYSTTTPFPTPSDDMDEGDAVPDGVVDIYVTYEYDADAADIADIDLTGATLYNMELGNRLYCFNGSRNDRPAAISNTNVHAEDLVNDEFVTINSKRYYFIWKLLGSDPYNIRLQSAYEGSDTDKHNSWICAKWDNNQWLKDERAYNQPNMNSGEFYNSFALLNPERGEHYYSLMAMNMSSSISPNAGTGKYPYLSVNGGDNPRALYKSTAELDLVRFHRLYTYTYLVTTPSGREVNAKSLWSGYALVNYPETEFNDLLLPEDIKRKYCEYTNYKAYDNATPITTFKEAFDMSKADPGEDVEESVDVYVFYRPSGLPFTVSTDYATAQWYTIAMDNNVTNKIQLDGSTFVKPATFNEANHANHFAFFGDPYELRVVNRQVCETAAGNCFVGVNAGAVAGDNLGSSSTDTPSASDIYTWEIIYDAGTGIYAGNMRLRQYGTANADLPSNNRRYWGWSSGNPVTYATEASQMRVAALPQYTYTYHIIDNSGRIAIKYSVKQDVSTQLQLSTIPSTIVSPFLILVNQVSPSYLSYYQTKTNDTSSPASDDGRQRYTFAGSISETPVGNSDIYVRYNATAMAAVMAASPFKMDGSVDALYNVRLNTNYIFYENSTSIGHESTDASKGDPSHKWYLQNSDPYAMQITNNVNGHYVIYSDADDGDGLKRAFSFQASSGPRSYYIAMSGRGDGIFEVMAATGETFDAATTYYSIGRDNTNGVKLYKNTAYAHGSNELRFILDHTSAFVTYHLIDKRKKVLFSIVSFNVALGLPADYQSPLIDKYHYYQLSDFLDPNTSAVPDPSDPDAQYELNGTPAELTTLKSDIYVTYNDEDINQLVDMNTFANRSSQKMYMLKFANGTPFHQENGSDDIKENAEKPVYPYSNGDANLYVYGDEELIRQQGNAASTRTRWAWYVESDNNDPYHVKIASLQAQSGSYNYLRTYVPQDYTGHVVTGVITPNATWSSKMEGETDEQLAARVLRQAPTEYMILGSAGKYKLMTSYPVDDWDAGTDNERSYVNSFEQYWKTYNTIKQMIFGLANSGEEQNTVPTTPASYRTTLTDTYGWHGYQAWANAVQWDNSPSGRHFEYIEHWYETVEMGDGTFDFVETSIDPVLILLDQHGWEITRKAIPRMPSIVEFPDDPVKRKEAQDKIDKLYAELRPYNSPMVKAYHFWHTGSKVPGYHKYTVADHITITDGDSHYDYTSTDLTVLPDYVKADNIKDAKSNIMDQYVTYEVKDEYALSYNAATQEASRFMVQQGTRYAQSVGGTSIAQLDADVTHGDLSKLIVEKNGLMTGLSTLDPTVMWYVKPNRNIDEEMGFQYSDMVGNAEQPWTKEETETYYNDNGLNGFDPYNIQLESVSNRGKYFTISNIVSARVGTGSAMEATYDGAPSVTLTPLNTTVEGIGYDNVTLKMTNGTFMAVQDANGNMRLMPRFDHGNRLTDLTEVSTTQAAASRNDNGMGSSQTSFLLRPVVYEYRIIDNEGHEALRFRKGGVTRPSVPVHLQSPFAKDFKFYKAASYDSGTKTYTIDESTDEVTSDDEITESFASAGLVNEATLNYVYVRYDYDTESDFDQLLQGKWMAMKLNEKYVQYNAGIAADGEPSTKPATLDDDAAAKPWQWKLLKSPWMDTDPYNVQLLNRNQKDLPMSASSLDNGAVTALADGTANTYQHYILLKHSGGDYALVVAGAGDATGPLCTDYYFIDGEGFDASGKAKIVQEPSFTSEVGIFADNHAKVEFIDQVTHNYTYKVITDAKQLAIEATEDEGTADGNGYVADLPEEAESPLLRTEDYRYYEDAAYDGGTGLYTVSTSTPTATLLGLYEDVVYVGYEFDKDEHTFVVPNLRNAKGTGDDAVEENGAAHYSRLDISGQTGYNFIWLSDEMMYGDGATVSSAADQDLTNTAGYLWKFKGNDPYDLKLVNGTKYLQSTTTPSSALVDTEGAATSFMLLKESGYRYGVLAQTGAKANKLNGPTGTLTTGTPAKYIIFALPTKKVIYQLVIAPKNGSQAIPRRTSSADAIDRTEDITGYTLRDLTGYALGDAAYSFDAGEVALGATLEVPEVLKRSFCDYAFYVHEIRDASNTEDSESALNVLYKGMNLENDQLWSDQALFNKTIYINIVYTPSVGVFDYAGNSATTAWYTLETDDATPYLANYTNQRNTLAAAEGRQNHYTNDYLWAIEGDPYGFELHNRYATKNGGAWNRVMTTSAAPADEVPLTLDNPATPNSIFEMIPGVVDGYCRLHPVADAGGTLFVRNNDGAMSLSTTASNWTLALNAAQLQPYADRTGYVGGLTESGLTAYNGAATLSDKQAVVYNPANIVTLTQGYWRIHDTQATPTYISGYTHKTEQTSAINLHYHEKAETQSPTKFKDLPASSFDETPATRGDLPLVAAMQDPASIFLFSPSSTTTTISTQGLYVNTTASTTSMSSTPENLTWMDIGGGVVMLRRGVDVTTGYLAPHSTQTKTITTGTSNELAEGTQWCLQPVNAIGLRVSTHNGGDNYYYTTFFAPFDVLMPTTNDIAYICKAWNDQALKLKSLGRYHTDPYTKNNQFIPANTPVIIRTTSSKGSIDMTLPSTTPSTAIDDPATNIFSGLCLEQLLALDAGDKVYALGQSYDGTGLTLNSTNGAVTGTAVRDNTGIGFYTNANYNRESDANTANWTRNNWYVHSNKIYYRAVGGALVRPFTRGINYVPIEFIDDEEDEEEQKTNDLDARGDGYIYDLQGRRVGSTSALTTRSSSLSPGIYIINGQKVSIR